MVRLHTLQAALHPPPSSRKAVVKYFVLYNDKVLAHVSAGCHKKK